MTTPIAAGRLRLYPEMAFGGFARRDGTVAFYTRVNALLTPTDRVLDYGCGIGAHAHVLPPFPRSLQVLRGRVAEVIGADVGDGATNPYIDRFIKIVGEHKVPLPDASSDLIVCDWGLEHFENPSLFFAECRRLLKPGGHLCLRTPNRWHYSSLGASLLPFKFHHAVRRWLGQFHGEDDVFPTHYRCNTRGALRRALKANGFEAQVIAHRGESHLAGAGWVPGLLGEMIEVLSPPVFWHELHVFARRAAD
jgi:SAM-dependent methyltransferase